MKVNQEKTIIVYDDRELASDEISSIVGKRRYGDILYRRKYLTDHFKKALPSWSNDLFLHIRNDSDTTKLRSIIESRDENCSICVFSSRAGFPNEEKLSQLIERLPYAEENFTDRLYNPLIVYIENAHWLIDHWDHFNKSPTHEWERAWQNSQRLSSIQPMDLGTIKDFLSFITGSTETRHFNQVQIDTYYYTKSSSDKMKMNAEYSFYSLVPERMKPWLIQTFDYTEADTCSSYKMLRYYLADAALQWVHGSFSKETFSYFVDRLLFFVSDRPRKNADNETIIKLTNEIFIDKVESRIKTFLDTTQGSYINELVSMANTELNIEKQFSRYKKLLLSRKSEFYFPHICVGHGDPCFSNILYDQQKYIMKLIDPKGAVEEHQLWTHPLYDLCKISHSVLGDYDFINNGLFSISFNEQNQITLSINNSEHDALKVIYKDKIKSLGFDMNLIRLGEASLFLSMLPLHLDHPNKVMAFMLTAKKILDEVENA
jgi:hypothetical protein